MNIVQLEQRLHEGELTLVEHALIQTYRQIARLSGSGKLIVSWSGHGRSATIASHLEHGQVSEPAEVA